MSDVQRVEIVNDDLNRPAAAEELANVPAMTQKDCMEIMRSPEYKTIRRVREITAAALAKSDFGSPVEARFDGSRPVEEGYQPMDEISAKQASVQKLFSDPRYKRDAAYRYEVQQRVAELTVNDNFNTLTGDAITSEDFTTPGRVMRVQVSGDRNHGAALAVQKFTRVAVGPAMTGPDAPMKPKPKREPFS